MDIKELAQSLKSHKNSVKLVSKLITGKRSKHSVTREEAKSLQKTATVAGIASVAVAAVSTIASIIID